MSGDNSGWSRGYDRGTSEETAAPPEPPDGHCPKCESTDIDRNPYGITESTGVGKSLFGSPMVQLQLVWCNYCGYTEFYQQSGAGNPLRWFLETDEE